MDHSHYIAVLLVESGISRDILLGFHAEAVRNGWTVQIAEAAEPDSGLLKDPRLDGVLLGPFTHDRLIASGWRRVPMVAAEIDLSRKSIPSVRVDDVAIGQMAADHLLSMGHRNFTAFGINKPWFRARVDGARRRVCEAGGQFLDIWNTKVNNNSLVVTSDVGSTLSDWLAKLPRPVAIMAGCDSWGRILCTWCRQIGIRVPEEVAIVGVDNEPLTCETSSPPLSSVSVPWRKVGAEAARLMAGLLASPKRRRGTAPLVLVRPNGVVVRRSSDAFAVADPNVATALRIIRDRATGNLGVPDLLRELPIGRHALQRAFRKHIGRPILGEIRRVRVERAKTLLSTTDLPTDEVATRSGFSSAAKLSELFRRETGTTPGAFRRAFRIS